jgi:hypothetical protein
MSRGGSLRVFGAMACWFVAHFLIYVRRPWLASPFEGEWDVLVAANAFAAGQILPVAAGSIHGYEVGSYLTAAVTSLPILLGSDPTLASRLVAAGIGAAGVGAAAWGTASLIPGDRGGERTLVAVSIALVATFCLPQWHWLNVGLTGTSIEAAVLLVWATLLAAASERTTRRSAAVGALLSAALLYSPLAWVGVPLILWLLLGGGTSARGAHLRAWLGGLVAPVIAAGALPGGPNALLNLGYSWWNLARGALRSAAVAGGLDADGPWAPLAALGSTAPSAFFDGRGTAGAEVLACVAPVCAVLAFGRRGVAARRLGLAVLYWLAVLSAVFVRSQDFPEVYRYWAVYDLLCVCCVCLLAGETSARPLRFAPVGLAAVGLVLTLRVPAPLPPPHRSLHEIVLSLGGHRTTERLGVRGLASDRHGTFVAVLPQVPTEHASAFVQAYGVSVADDLSEPGMIAWWPEWELARLKDAVDRVTWERFLLGFGCGLVAQDRLDVERMQLLDGLSSSEWEAVYGGAAACTEGAGAAGFGNRRAPPSTAQAAACMAGAAVGGCAAKGAVVEGLWRVSSAAGGAR